jgi:hypothetical protein
MMLYQMDAVDARLWPYLDGCTVGHQPDDFFHLLVCDGDATFGPVNLSVKAANP